ETIDTGVKSHAKYQYDANGNRIFEGYYSDTTNGVVYYQWSNAVYDELNRVIAIHDPKYDMGVFDANGKMQKAGYEYDANGNRVHVYARYHDGFQANVQTQDYWY